MKIIYEPGDMVTLQDDVDVPNNMANLQVELIEELGDIWKVRIDDFYSYSRNGEIAYVDKCWFYSPY